MSTPAELKYEMSKGLLELYVEVTEDRLTDVSPDEISTKMDKFLNTWSDRIVAEGSAQLKAHHKEFETANREISEGATNVQESDVDRVLNADFQKAEAAIGGQVSQLITDLVVSMRDINNDRAPSPAMAVIEQQIAMDDDLVADMVAGVEEQLKQEKSLMKKPGGR